MKAWTESAHCASRAHCVACRTEEAFRESIVRAGMAAERDFACPHGVTAETAETAPAQRREQGAWPVWARFIARRAEAGERGIGDTVARLLGGAGKGFEAWFERVFGKSCGCGQRKARLNARFPYPADDPGAGEEKGESWP